MCLTGADPGQFLVILDMEARSIMAVKPSRERTGTIILGGTLLFASRFSFWGPDFQFTSGTS